MSILEIKDVTYGYTKLEHILFEVNHLIILISWT